MPAKSAWRCCLWLFACALPLAPLPARADPQDIEEGEPVSLEDAYTSPPGLLSLQYSNSYTTLNDGGRKAVDEQGPTFKLGAFKNIQISVNPNYDTARYRKRNSGTILNDLKIQLNDETRLLPTVSFDTFYAVPFGAGYKSAEYVFRAIASKQLGATEQAPRLHLNLEDFHQIQPENGSRTDQLELVFGGSTELTRNAALITDIVAGEAEKIGQHETFLEAGYSRDLPGGWTLELGLGKQVAGPAHALRIFFSIETDVQIFE